MNQLNTHNLSLRSLLESDDNTLDSALFAKLIDLDSIDLVLRKCLSIEEMRVAGSFFTGSRLAKAVVDAFPIPVSYQSVVIDPTCGAGNLLIECSRRLSVADKLSSTLKNWGKSLWGFDISKSFVETTKLRLVIEALSRGALKDCSIDEAFGFLANIKDLDAMSVSAYDLEKVTHVVMNPPFSIWSSPQTEYWKKGKVNAAGVIFDKYMRVLPDSCQVSAILPDVLRSGSRYESFRLFISRKLDAKCKVWGRFNKKTDVDVFMLSGTLCKERCTQIVWFKDLGDYTPLSEAYDVCTGPLVAYRDEVKGTSYPYFHPKNSPVWESVSEASEYRRFQGKTIKPPFVLVKRTSSPTDKFRASATLVNLESPVAVENHLIVIKPKSGLLSDCEKLIGILKRDETNSFLNDRARMRHLTVKVVKEIPV